MSSCGLEQRLLNVLLQNDVIETTASGIRLKATAIKLAEVVNSFMRTIGGSYPLLTPFTSRSILDVDVNGNVSFTQEFLDTLQDDGSGNDSEGATSVDTNLDLILKDGTRIDVYMKERRRLLFNLRQSRFKASFILRTNNNLTQEEVVDLNSKILYFDKAIEELEGQINTIKEKKHITIKSINLNADVDFQKVEDFLNGSDNISYEDIDRIIEFYSKLPSLEDNSLFEPEFILDDKGNMTEDFNSIVEGLRELSNKAKRYKAQIEVRRREMVMGILATNPSYTNLYKDNMLTFDELMFYKEGLPDTSFIDKYLMDITNGIINSNGIIPQIMQMHLDRSIAEHSKYLRDLQREMDKVLKPAEREVNKHSEGWGIFFDKTDTGLRKDTIVGFYSDVYNEALSKIFGLFKFNLNKLSTEKDPVRRGRLKRAALNDKFESIQKLCHIFDVNKIPELSSNPTPEQEAYKAFLISEIGEYAYEKTVEHQRELLNSYEVRLAIITDQYNKANPTTASMNIQKWEEENSPYSVGLYNSLEYVAYVPKTKIVDSTGNIVDSNFFNKRFNVIASNPSLLAFYKLLEKNQRIIRDLLPVEKQVQLGRMSLLSMEKTFTETLSDKNMTFLAKVSYVFRKIYEYIKNLGYVDRRQFFKSKKIDPITGKPIVKISDEWFVTNKGKIEELMDEYFAKITNTLGKDGAYAWDQVPNINLYNNKEIMGWLAELLGCNPIATEVYRRLGMQDGSYIDVYKAFHMAISDNVMADQSIDIPKMLLVQMQQVSLYAARTAVLPELNLLREYYNSIKTSEGKLRKNGIAQMDSWFNRVVLDNYEINNELVRADNYIKDKGKAKEKYTKLELARKEELEAISASVRRIADATQDPEEAFYLRKKADNIDAQIAKIGKVFSLNSAVNKIFNYLRFKSLGYNVSSNVTNFLEGQISNFINGELGVYYTSAQLHRANQIMSGSVLSAVTFGKYHTDGAKKAGILMRKLDVQQDASNILQQATKNNEVDKLSKLGPYEFTKRAEFLNQSPVLVAMLLNQKILDKNGKESNVWDALNEQGKLKEEFRTDDNIKTWEDLESEEFYAFKSKVSKAIVDIHGDYHNTHGNMASEYATGKLIIMFKKWMIRMIYARFGAEQVDLESGQIKAKGRYRSMTRGNMMLFIGMSGLMFNPILGLAGLGIGYFVGGKYGIDSGTNLVTDLAQNIKGMLMYAMKIPVNKLLFFRSTETISTDDLVIGDNLNKKDLDNIKANLAELAMAFWMFIFMLLFKSLASDDEEEDPVLTVLINKNMQAMQQLTSYINPLSTYRSLSEMAILRTMDEVSTLGTETWKMILGDNNKFDTAAKKFVLPSVVRSGYFGFESQSKFAFEDWDYDPLLMDDEAKAKKQIKKIRDEYKEEIGYKDMDEKSQKKAKNKLDRVTKKRNKKETEVERLERIRKQIEKIK